MFRHRSRRSFSRTLTTVALAAAILLLLPLPEAEAQAPLRLQGLDGGTLGDADLGRGVVVVIVWASWSPRGQDVAARVNAIHDKWSSRARVVTVNFQDEPDAIRTFVSKHGQLAAPIFLDRNGDFAQRHTLTSLPGLVVFKDGEKLFGGRLPDQPDDVIGRAF